MGNSDEVQPYCKSCNSEIEGTEEVCPHCGFHPRNVGLRYAALFMIGVALLFSFVILAGGTWPYLAGYAMLGVFLLFIVAIVVFVISFLATPYRFGGIFA